MESRDRIANLKEKVLGAALKRIDIPLKVMPLWMEAFGFGLFLSHVLDEHPGIRKKLKEIEGKVFRFEAADIGKAFYLMIKEDDIKVVPHFNGEADVLMKGKVSILSDVFLGKEDPDTVFFTRKLEITGDTSTAIYFKNILANYI